MKENKDIQDIGKFFNGYASDFSSIYLEDERPRSFFNKVMDRLFRKDIETRLVDTVSSINTDAIKTVLDIGCGPGHLVVKLLELEKDVTALDIAPNMLSITQARVELIMQRTNLIRHLMPPQSWASLITFRILLQSYKNLLKILIKKFIYRFLGIKVFSLFKERLGIG